MEQKKQEPIRDASQLGTAKTVSYTNLDVYKRQYRSISISSQCPFYFVLYCFI